MRGISQWKSVPEKRKKATAKNNPSYKNYCLLRKVLCAKKNNVY